MDIVFATHRIGTDAVFAAQFFTVVVGDSAALGPTLTGTSTLSAGSASGEVGSVNATAPGATLTGAGTISAGAASGSTVVNATAPGATLTGVSSLTTNSASGEQNATAPGATLTGASSISAGTASGEQNAAALGATLNGESTLSSGGATGDFVSAGSLTVMVNGSYSNVIGVTVRDGTYKGVTVFAKSNGHYSRCET